MEAVYIIRDVMNPNLLGCTVYFTYDEIEDGEQANELLALTYNPQYRYLCDEPNAPPIKIDERNPRVVPAFGKSGGATELIFRLSTNKLQLSGKTLLTNGGATERWYMGAWTMPNVLAAVFSGVSGARVTATDFTKAFKTGEEIKLDTLRFQDRPAFPQTDDIIMGSARFTHNGIIFSSALSEIRHEEITVRAYFSVSCGFQLVDEILYLRFWGAIWEDFLISGKEDKSHIQGRICYLHRKMIEKGILRPGMRLYAYPIETETIQMRFSEKDDEERLRFRVNELTSRIANYCKYYYQCDCWHPDWPDWPHACWCATAKKMVLLEEPEKESQEW
jgi:hypothetical protein